MAAEEWSPCSRLHDVSDKGRVRNRVTGRILWVNRNPRTNYCRVGFYRGLGRGVGPRLVAVHRLVLTAFVGPCPPGQECNHKDGNRLNNFVENLEWVTPSENNKHAYDVLGKVSQKGSKHGRSKLREHQVLDMRRLHGLGVRGDSLSILFRCSKSTVSGIVNRRHWTHI